MPQRFTDPPIDESETVRLPAAQRPDISQHTTRLLGVTLPPPLRLRRLVILSIAIILALTSAVNLAFIIKGEPHTAFTSTTAAVASATMTTAPILFSTATHAATVTVTATPRPVLPPPPPTPAPIIQLPPEHTLPSFCPPATPTPTPGVGTVTPTTTATVAPTPTPSCVTCPWQFSPQSFSRDQVQTALTAAAQRYHLPHNLVFAVARLESGWNPYFISCSDDIGLMQLKRGLWQSMDDLNVPECGLTATAYDPYDLQQNAYLGAKVLAWLTCFFSYWGGTSGASLANPGSGTIGWYYAQAHLQYPDITLANGKANPASFCGAVYQDPNHPEYAALSATNQQTWSCPYSATKGDSTLLDIVVSAYNQGIGTTINNGIQNQWYVNIVEAFIAQYGQRNGAG